MSHGHLVSSDEFLLGPGGCSPPVWPEPIWLPGVNYGRPRHKKVRLNGADTPAHTC